MKATNIVLTGNDSEVNDLLKLIEHLETEYPFQGEAHSCDEAMRSAHTALRLLVMEKVFGMREDDISSSWFANEKVRSAITDLEATLARWFRILDQIEDRIVECPTRHDGDDICEECETNILQRLVNEGFHLPGGSWRVPSPERNRRVISSAFFALLQQVYTDAVKFYGKGY